jgi:hypothetical protein
LAGAGWRQVSLICDDEKVLLIGECIEPCSFVDDIRDKLLSRVGWKLDEFPYYSPRDLEQAFTGLLTETRSFVWKGIEIFWGRKPG